MNVVSEGFVISEDMTIGFILTRYPDTIKVFERHGLRCTRCKGAKSEPLKNVSNNYGINLTQFMDELKEALRATDWQKKQ